MNAATEPAALRRARLVVAYDGAGFHGFAETTGQRTVMGDLATGMDSGVGASGSGHLDGNAQYSFGCQPQFAHHGAGIALLGPAAVLAAIVFEIEP